MNFLGDYKNCTLCPRRCQVDRATGHLGICGESAACRISFIGSHFGEEPSFSGTFGSGTIFFSGCSSRCFFCQNYQISLQHEGKIFSSGLLLSEVKKLIAKEVHNLNFVTPDHFWPHIKILCEDLVKEGIKIPKIFNSSGYQRSELVEEYAQFMDIFMPDFKFSDPDLAQMCMKDKKYPGIALQAIREMVRYKGFLEPWDPAGENPAQKGVLVRHLVLPGHVNNSLKALQLLHQEFGPGIPLSVMSQYRPMPACLEHEEFRRGVQAAEYEQVLTFVKELKFEKVYVQELVEKTAFLPDFQDPEDPFPGNRKRP